MELFRFVLCIVAIFVGTYAVGPNLPQVRPAGLPTFTPEGGNLDGSAFSQWVATQAAGGAKAVALAQGQYDVQNPNNDRKTYILFDSLDNIAVWMDGVSLVLPDNTITAFTIDHSNKLATYGPTAWWSVPGFGQATITSSKQTGDNAYQIQFKCDAGYDCSGMVQNGQLSAEYIDPDTGLLQAGIGWSTLEGPATTLDSNSWQFDFTDAYFEPLVGFKVLSRGTFIFCNQVTSSNYTSINDFTLLNCGGFSWFSNSNIRTEFNSLSIKPASFPPPGGTELPVRSSSADGIHSAEDFVGPQFDSCLIGQLDDDCIAIHGTAGKTTNYQSGNTFEGNVGAVSGDTIEFVTSDTFIPIGTATVTKVGQDGDNNQITVDGLPQGFSAGNTLYINRNRVGSGFSITNTRTFGNRGRGFIVKASDGNIANNVIEASTYSGIYLGPEFTQWNEAGYVRNVTVTNNQILNSGYISYGVSAFDIHGDSNAIGNSNNDLSPMGNGNSDITVSNLLISDNGGAVSQIYIGAAVNIKMSGVVIQNALQGNYTIHEATPDALVNFQNVQFSGTPDICQINTGTLSSGSVAYVKNYGTVQNGIDNIPKCSSVPTPDPSASSNSGASPTSSSSGATQSSLSSQASQTTAIAPVSQTTAVSQPSQTSDSGGNGDEDECED